MRFEERSSKANLLIDIVKEHIWDKFPSLYHVEFGYETHIPENVRNRLRLVWNETARHVRYAPDFFIVESQNPDRVYLLEYKCTQTPIYSQNRINFIARVSNRQGLRWQDIGQWERDAFDNYAALRTIGVRVVILNYIAYHERLLLCDFIENIQELHRDRVTTDTRRGSRTPFVNFDANSMKTLQEFLTEVHGISSESITPYFEAACEELKRRLPIEHHPSSPYGRR